MAPSLWISIFHTRFQKPRIRLAVGVLVALGISTYLFSHLYPSQPLWLTVRPRPLNISKIVEEHPANEYRYAYISEALRAAPPPSTHTCTNNDSTGPLLLVGIFSTAYRWQKRDLLRSLQTYGLNNVTTPLIEFKFILGMDDDPEARRIVEAEQQSRGDLVVLPIGENMNSGKSHAFFHWAGSRPEGSRPRFVMKTDDDTFLVIPNLLRSFSSLDCSLLIYWGSSWSTCSECSPFYMQGLGHALSWPLVRWIWSANVPFEDTWGTEDMRTAQWMQSLPPDESLLAIDWGIHIGNYDDRRVPRDIHTIALHRMKEVWQWVEIATTLTNAWKKAGREYTWLPS